MTTTAFEALEPREVLAAVSWDGGAATANWHDSANWSNDAVPTADDDVTIPVTALASINFTAATGSRSVNSLNSAEDLTFSGGTLTVVTTATTTAPVTLSGATLSGGAWSPASIAASAGTLLNVALAGDITVNTSGTITIAGSATFGVLRLLGGASGLFGPGYVLQSTVRAEGTGTGVRTVRTTANTTFTVGPTGVIERASGCAGSLTIGTSTMTLSNQGTILNNAVGGSLTINAVALTNQGQISCTDATLNLNGTWTSSGSVSIVRSTLNLGGFFSTSTWNIGAFSRTAGTVNITGNMGNSDVTLNAATGTWFLSGGTISGGSIRYADGATLQCLVGTLSGVTFHDDLLVGASTGLGVVLTSSTTFGTARLGAGALLKLPNDGYVMNSAIIADGAGTALRRIGVSSPGSLTIGPAGRIELAATCAGSFTLGGSFATIVSQGLIQNNAPNRTLTLTLFGATYAGEIQANAGTTIIEGNWTNTGRIAATDAILNLQGTWSSTGIVDAQNSTVNLGGTFTMTNTGAAGFHSFNSPLNITGTMNITLLTLAPSAQSWVLRGGTISGGILTCEPGSSLRAASGMLLNTTIVGDAIVTDLGSITLGGSTRFSALRLSNGATALISGDFTLYDLLRAEGPGSATRTIGQPDEATIFRIAPTGTVELAPDCGSNFLCNVTFVDNRGTFVSRERGRTLALGVPGNYDVITHTLNGGTWKASGGATLMFQSLPFIANLNAAFEIDGPTSAITGLGPTLMVSGSLILRGGKSLTVTSLTNNGTIDLGADSRITISTNFVQSATGTLVVDLRSISSLGSIVASSAALGGSLVVHSSNGFDPSSPMLPLFVAEIITSTSTSGAITLASQPSLLVGSYVARIGSSGLRILHNVADFNGDGGVDGDDVIAFMNDWDSANSLADLNGDGGVDGDDLIFFFGLWNNGGR